MSGRAVLLILNGELRSPRAVRAASRGAVVICADGGARHAAALGLRPDFVVGDLDSLPRALPRSWKRTIFVRDADAERSDLDKALDLACALSCRRLTVAAALGGGLDHSLVNLAVLERRGLRLGARVIDRGLAVLLGPGVHRPALRRGCRFSLLAAPRARVALAGARYPLSDEPLARGSRGLGNAVAARLRVRVRSGAAWLMVDDPGFRG